MISLVHTKNLPRSADAMVTVAGLNMGFFNTSPQCKTGGGWCRTTSWSSSTAMRCSTNAAAGGHVACSNYGSAFVFYQVPFFNFSEHATANAEVRLAGTFPTLLSGSIWPKRC